MAEAKLTVLGVYRPRIGFWTFRKQLRVTGDRARTRKHFAGLVLIEAIASGLNEPFDMRKFGQIVPAFDSYPEGMQVGYDEGLLSPDGEALIERNMKCLRRTGTLRFAVFLHYSEPNQPLLWQGGEVICPPVEDAPRRLRKLIPYHACC